MKKLMLSLVFVLGAMTMVNANTSVNRKLKIDIAVAPPGWDCDEWSNFCFEWAQLCGASFNEAASVADAEFHKCLKEQKQQQ